MQSSYSNGGHMTASSSSSKGESSIDRMMHDLNEHAEELDSLMRGFYSDRSSALLRQKQALANYDAEMDEIENLEMYGEERYNAMTR